MNRWMVSEKDKEILRRLAAKQYEYSQLPIMKEREKEWYLHNDLQGQRPMIHVEAWTFKEDILPQLMECEGEYARRIEETLRHNMINHEFIGDDIVVKDHYNVGWKTWFKLFDREITTEKAKDAEGREIGHHFNYIIEDLEQDFEKLGQTQYGVDREGTLEEKEFLEELFGDVLPVKLTGGCLGACLTQNIVHLMGMENMLFSMFDYPELFHEMMNRMTSDIMAYFDWQEKEGLIFATTGNQHLGQGSLCYTNKLLTKEQIGERNVVTKDIWGYMDSQETVGMSPEMFKEFIFPYYKRIGERFGRLSYGCCEPVHPYWEECIESFENLSKISISPWCDQKYIGEKLRERKNVIFHRKPSPNFLGVGKELDEEAFKKHILETLESAKGCKLEFAQRDVYTVTGNIPKLRRYVEIIRNLSEKHYQA